MYVCVCVCVCVSVCVCLRFAETLHHGFPEYGVAVNPAKTRTNFKLSIAGKALYNVCEVPDSPDSAKLTGYLAWNGFLINAKSLEVLADYSKNTNTDTANHVTMPTRQVGLALLNMLKRTVMTRAHPILLDSLINSPGVVALNVFQTFVLSAARLYALMNKMQGLCLCARVTLLLEK